MHRGLTRATDYMVVGGGFAGLNAVAGIRKTAPSANIVCVDRRPAPGGSWNDYYSFAKLHAPHPHFGVNGQPWALGDPSILASRDSVLSHFGGYVDGLVSASASSGGSGAAFEFAGGSEFVSFDKAADGGGVATVRTAVDGQERQVTVGRAVINACGFDYTRHTPATECSKAKDGSTFGKEVEARDLPASLAQRSRDRQYVVIGGGKTGVDACLWLADQKAPKDDILLVTGSNKAFINRDVLFPRKEKLTTADPTVLDFFLRCSALWNGRSGEEGNAEEVLAEMLTAPAAVSGNGKGKPFLHHLTSTAGSGSDSGELAKTFAFGVASEDELRKVQATAHVVTNDHVAGLDEEAGKVLLASGAEVSTAKEIVLVNCRSSVGARESAFVSDVHPLRPDGSVNFGSLLGFTGPTNYLLCSAYAKNPKLLHDDGLWLYGYKESYAGRTNADWSMAFGVKLLANSLCTMPAVGTTLFSHTLDFAQWHPLFNQVKSFGNLISNREMVFDRAGRSLRKLQPGDQQPL